jgi:hypothetical protein
MTDGLADRRTGAPEHALFRASVRLCAGALLLLLAACTDLRMNPAIDRIQVPLDSASFKNDIMPVLRTTCGSSGACHGVVGTAGPVLGLNLQNDSAAYASLVNVVAVNAPSMMRVRPGLPDSSFMYRVLIPNPTYRLGYYRMPLTQLPLPFETTETIRNWILKGALNN